MLKNNKTVPASGFHVCDLRVDNLSGYVSIGNAEPRFSWKMSSKPGDMQKAYRIQAASSASLLGKPDLWDSGWVESELSISIPWGGEAARCLLSGAQFRTEDGLLPLCLPPFSGLLLTD